MSLTYTRRSHSEELAQPSHAGQHAQGASNSAMMGAENQSAAAMGRSVSMPASLRQRMENSFGADFSGVKFIESQQVADNGADAVTLGGGKVGFAPGKLDFTSKQGQELIGHELAHVVSHARGEVTGRGFLGNASLEAQADRQGEMAAAGQSVYTGPVTPLSASTVASAEGPMQAKKNKTPIGTSMRDLGGEYSSQGMADRIATLTPKMHEEVGNASQSLNVTDGNRFFYMRGGKGEDDPRLLYAKMLSRGARESNKKILGDMSKKLSSMPNLDDVASYKAFTDDDKRRSDVQNRSVEMTQKYLAHLQGDENAMDALKKSADMYGSLGTYSDENKGGMVGGRLEASHRAMNDMLLRSFGTDSIMGRKDLGLNQSDDKKVAIVGQAMAAMQPAVLGSILDPTKKDELTPQEQQLAEIFQKFFADNGMLGDAAPTGTGEKTSAQTMAYRSDEIGALAKRSDYDPTAENGNLIGMRRMYDKIKNPDASDTPEQISARKRFFAEQRAAQMDEQYRSQHSPISAAPAPAAPKKKWWQFWK